MGQFERSIWKIDEFDAPWVRVIRATKVVLNNSSLIFNIGKADR